MKYAAVLLTLAASVFSQSLADLPTCSISCLTSAVSASGCGVTDYTCQCGSKKDAITAAVTPCLQKACSAADQATVLSITSEICASVAGTSSSATSAASGASTAKTSATSASTTHTAAGSSAASQSTNAAGRVGAAGALIAAAGLLAL